MDSHLKNVLFHFVFYMFFRVLNVVFGFEFNCFVELCLGGGRIMMNK